MRGMDWCGAMGAVSSFLLFMLSMGKLIMKSLLDLESLSKYLSNQGDLGMWQV